MTRLYHASIYDTTATAPSFWEASAPPLERTIPQLEGSQTADVAIIGGGFSGLSAAHELASREGVKVVVLEAARNPLWGASGRNGGFCCLGAHKLGLKELRRRYGEQETRRFFDSQREAVESLGQFCEDKQIEIDRHSQGEIELAHRPNRVPELQAEAEMIQQVFGRNSEFLSREALAERGIAGPEFHAGLIKDCGFALHPLKYGRGLARAAIDTGAIVYGNSEVERIESSPKGYLLKTAKGEVDAKKILIATNGFGQDALPKPLAGWRLPAISSILVTRPLSDEDLAAQGWTSDLMAYDSRRLLHYFRLLPQKRFLFGGRGGTDASPEGMAKTKERLVQNFHRMFPAWAGVEIDYFWYGLVCLNQGLVPFVGEIPGMPGAYAAMCYHGNGVAMASWSGRAVASVMSGRVAAEDRLSAVLRGPIKPFALPGLRMTALKSAYLAYGLKDEWL